MNTVMHNLDESALAYSYIRFSSPEQRQGDSLRRQTHAAADWCERNRIRLDTSLTLRDLGTSAYTGEHRKNPDRHALAAFLKLVSEGRIRKGSYLIIENLGRLSREEERPALRLWLDLLDQGINIVQLEPETIFRHEKSDMVDVMRAIIELSRGHGESEMKSHRIGKAWRQKIARARESKEVLTNSLPAWVEQVGGKLKLMPQRAAVAKTLKDRRALGEHQPRGKDRKPVGDPIPHYYPAVITEDEFHTARGGALERKLKPGRLSQHVNVFARAAAERQRRRHLLRLRSAIRKIVDSIWLAIATSGADRLCEAQVWFTGCQRFRSYMITQRPPRANVLYRKPGCWYVNSIDQPEGMERGMPFNTEDLRDPDQAACVLGFLENYPQESMDKLLELRPYPITA